MKIAFLISAIIEIVGGIAMYFSPHLMFDEALVPLSKFYALAAIVIGMINAFAFLHFSRNVFFKKLFLLMFGFHGALAFLCFGMPETSMPLRLEATLTHLACFVIFFITYMKDVGVENK